MAKGIVAHELNAPGLGALGRTLQNSRDGVVLSRAWE
jgi:hypothetical protein